MEQAAAASDIKDTIFARVKDAIEELRPHLRGDGGDCQLVSVEGNLVTVRMAGACIGCQFAGTTLTGLQERLIARLGVPLRIATVPPGR